MKQARHDEYRARFVILTQYFPPEVGAAQTRLASLAKELQRRGHSVEVVTAMPNYPFGRVFPAYRGRWFMREQIEGLTVIRTWILAAGRSGNIFRLLGYWSYCLSALVGCMVASRPDYLIVESPPLFLSLTAYVISRIRRAPLVLIVSDLWPASVKALGLFDHPILMRFAERLERFVYRSAARVTAVTGGIHAAVCRTCGDKDKLLYLPNGVDTSLFRPQAQAADECADSCIGEGEIVMIYAGTHGHASDLDVILGAANLMRHRQDLVFLFVGEGPEKERLRRAAAADRLNNVRFVAGKPLVAMPALFARSRAAIVPVRGGPLFRGTRPAKMFPAMASSVPIIYCGEGESAELIESNRCGIVVPPETPWALADVVAKLADDAVLAGTLGRNGRTLVERDFTWAVIVDHWLSDLLRPKDG
jgi:glycosyltransferase involved in cell wall biosynthesis